MDTRTKTIIDNVQSAIQGIESNDARFVTRVVVIYETMDGDGNRYLQRYASPGMAEWDITGFLEHEPELEDDD